MPVDMTAIWVLDVVIALGMISAAVAVLTLGRKLGDFSKSLSATVADVRKQADDLQSEAVRLMQSTQVSEQHFDRLASQLTKLTASADTAVRALPAAASGRDSRLLPRVMSTVVGVVSAYKFLKSIFPRRKS
jgi:Sec-independent protein translocase protein TatA